MLTTVSDVGLVESTSTNRPQPVDLTKRNWRAQDQVLDFELFYEASSPQLFRSLSLAVGDVDLAYEALDEAMVRAYKRWRKVGRYDNPGGWVYRVALNWARTRLSKRSREVLTSKLPDCGFSDHIDPDLHQALMALSIDARAVVVLRHLEGWSTEEVAVTLGIAPGTVKSRLSRALDELRPILGVSQ